jgi:nitrite reductase/ring-hydroxylating ferredoxin subunit
MNPYKKSNLKYFWLFSLFFILFIRCEDPMPYFPYVRVDAYFSISTQLDNLQPDQYIQVDGHGLGGLIIYRRNNAVFEAYDAACTHEANADCILKEDPDFNLFTCPCCGSSFFIYQEGNVFNGPARRPLRQYRVTYNPPDRLHVYNY